MIDWEWLKAELSAARNDGSGMHTKFISASALDSCIAILAQHEQDQRVIEAAEKMKYCLLFCKDQTTDYRVRAAIDSAIDRFDKVVKP